MSIEASAHRIRSYFDHADMSVTAIAEQAGLKRTTVQSIKANGWRGSVDSLAALESIVPPDWQPTPADTTEAA